MTTKTQNRSGHSDNRRVALSIGVYGGLGMVISSAIGEDGAFIGLGAGVGAAVGLIMARMRRP